MVPKFLSVTSAPAAASRPVVGLCQHVVNCCCGVFAQSLALAAATAEVSELLKYLFLRRVWLQLCLFSLWLFCLFSLDLYQFSWNFYTTLQFDICSIRQSIALNVLLPNKG